MNLKITRRWYLIKGSLKTRQYGRSIEVPLVNIKEKNQKDSFETNASKIKIIQ